jgi:hypothetical protein
LTLGFTSSSLCQAFLLKIFALSLLSLPTITFQPQTILKLC